MALVRISKELLIAVSQQVQDVTAKAATLQIEPMHPKVTSELLDELEGKVVTYMWGDYLALRNQIPESWKTKATRIDVTLSFNGKGVAETIEINKMFYCPPNSRISYDRLNINLPIVDGLAAEFATKHLAYKIALNAHLAKYKEVTKQIEKFLKEAKSLNDALRRFPDLALYIPKTFLDRIELKVERGVKEVPPTSSLYGPELDRDLVVSTGIIGALIK